MSQSPKTDALHEKLVRISEGPDWIAGKDYVEMRRHAADLEAQLTEREGMVLPDYDDLPDKLKEDIEVAVLNTMSDEDHWCQEASESVYDIIKKHFDAAPKQEKSE